MTGDVNQVEGLIVNTSNSLIRQFFGVGFALVLHVVATAGHWRCWCSFRCPSSASACSFSRAGSALVYRSIREATGQFSAKLTENLSGIRVIKAFNREPIEHELVSDTSQPPAGCQHQGFAHDLIFYPAIHARQHLGTVIVLGVGAY